MSAHDRKLPLVGRPLPEVLQRPRCGYCDKRLQPIIRTNYAQRQVPRTAYKLVDGPSGTRSVETETTEMQTVWGEAISREWSGSYHSYGSFCTLRCCEAFANAAYKAGYRIIRSRRAA